MKNWAADPVNPANLNATFGAEALVIAGAAQSGAIYPNITDALTAGHRSILVDNGNYAEDVVISNPGVKLVAVRTGHNSTSYGATVSGSITIAADSVVVEDITSYGSSTSGFIIRSGSQNVHLNRVLVRQSTDHGILIGDTGGGATGANFAVFITKPWIYLAGGHGIYHYGAETDQHSEVQINAPWIYSATGTGIRCSAVASPASDRFVRTIINGGVIRSCGTYGIYSSQYNGMGVSGTEIYSCQTGVYMQTPYATYPEHGRDSVKGCELRGHSVSGISCQANTDKHVVIGNTLHENTANLVNCDACIGVVADVVGGYNAAF